MLSNHCLSLAPERQASSGRDLGMSGSLYPGGASYTFAEWIGDSCFDCGRHGKSAVWVIQSIRCIEWSSEGVFITKQKNGHASLRALTMATGMAFLGHGPLPLQTGWCCALLTMVKWANAPDTRGRSGSISAWSVTMAVSPDPSPATTSSMGERSSQYSSPWLTSHSVDLWWAWNLHWFARDVAGRSVLTRGSPR